MATCVCWSMISDTHTVGSRAGLRTEAPTPPTPHALATLAVATNPAQLPAHGTPSHPSPAPHVAPQELPQAQGGFSNPPVPCKENQWLSALQAVYSKDGTQVTHHDASPCSSPAYPRLSASGSVAAWKGKKIKHEKQGDTGPHLRGDLCVKQNNPWCVLNTAMESETNKKYFPQAFKSSELGLIK